MKIFISICLFIAINTINGFSQVKPVKADTTADDGAGKEYAVIEQAGKPLIFTTELVRGDNDALQERFIHKKEAGELYGKDKERDFLYEKLKPELELLNLTQIFALFHIHPSDQKLEVFVDMRKVRYPKKMIAVKSALISADVIDFKGNRIINIKSTANQIGGRSKVNKAENPPSN